MKLANRLLATCLLSASCSAAFAAQPADGGYDVMQQAPNECGPTITWLILNHHYQGSILRTGSGRTDYYNATLPSVCVGDAETCTTRSANIQGASEYQAWIEMQRDGRVGPPLDYLADRLTLMRDPATGKRLFEVEGNYESPSKSDVAARRARLATIRGHLDNDRPVVIHLERPWFISGHYVSLVGYERSGSSFVYLYADTVQPEKGLLRVSEADLAGADAWYDNGSGNYLARWNGRYMGFWPQAASTAPSLPEVEQDAGATAPSSDVVSPTETTGPAETSTGSSGSGSSWWSSFWRFWW